MDPLIERTRREMIDLGWFEENEDGRLVPTEEGERMLEGDSEDDLPEPVDDLDLGDYRSAAGAAKATYRWLRQKADTVGQDPDIEVAIRRPGENPWDAPGWHVVWEGGPYEWAIALTGGSSMYSSEFGGGGTAEVTGLHDADGWHAEPGYSFSLLFYDD